MIQIDLHVLSNCHEHLNKLMVFIEDQNK